MTELLIFLVQDANVKKLLCSLNILRMLSIKVYTVSDLFRWINDEATIGLAKDVISNARALAFINNPYATSETPAIAVAFDGERPVGYTAAFPDKLDDEIIFWGTTGFIDASMRGKGVGTLLYSTMMKATGNKWFASDSTPAALAISKKTGLNIKLYDKYYLSFSHSNRIFSILRACMMRFKNKRVLKNLSLDVDVDIVRNIDNPTYAFIVKHSDSQLFVREQIMYNWLLQYPFVTQAPNYLNSYYNFEFSTISQQYGFYVVRLYHKGVLVGIMMFRQNNGELTLLYLFYETNYKAVVLNAIIIHMLKQKISCFRTMEKDVIEYFDKVGAMSMNSKSRKYQISLSTPVWFNIDNKNLQSGDGDMFA